MSIEHIQSLLFRYVFAGLAVLAVLLTLFLIGWLMYKKVFHGKKELSKKYLALGAISFLYLFVVVCAVFADRAEYEEGVQSLFASYRHAWYYWRPTDWMNIVLNILLFVPFGFFFPLWSKKLDKFYVTVPAGFLLTLVIEFLQYILKLGVFEWDDILNNTMGALLGYCALQIVICAVQHKQLKKALLCGVPYLAVVAVFGGIFLAYAAQPYGNLQLSYYAKQAPNNISVTVGELPDFGDKANVYKQVPVSREEARAAANALFEAADIVADDTTEFYEDGRFSIETTDGDYTFTMDTENGTYRFEKFAYFWMDSSLRPSTPLSSEEVRLALQAFGIDLPPDCPAQVEEGDCYVFSPEVETQKGIMRGTLYCYINESGDIVGITNDIVTLQLVSSEDIINVQEAVERIRAGRYSAEYLPASDALVIKSCEISFSEDSKGFYQPVYLFTCEVTTDSETTETHIPIPALK